MVGIGWYDAEDMAGRPVAARGVAVTASLRAV